MQTPWRRDVEWMRRGFPGGRMEAVYTFRWSESP